MTITITEMKTGELHVAALCRACHLVRERFIPNEHDARGHAYIIATDALAEAGCPHIEAVTITKRKALTTPPPAPKKE